MVMIRPKGKPEKIAQEVMRKSGVSIKKDTKQDTKTVLQTPYLQH